MDGFETEVNKAKNLIESLGGSPEKFDIRIEHGIVTVSTSSQARSYQSNSMINWLNDFENDYRNGWDDYGTKKK